MISTNIFIKLFATELNFFSCCRVIENAISLFQECIRAYITDSGEEETLVLRVQDPFHRLLLHGVCEVNFSHSYSPIGYLLLILSHNIITN